MDSTSASATRFWSSSRSIPPRWWTALEVGGMRRTVLAERQLQRLGERGVVLVGRGEDPTVGNLAGQMLQQLLERLRGHRPGGRVIDVDLAVSAPDGIQRPRVLLRHVDLEGVLAKGRWQRLAHAILQLLHRHERLAAPGLEEIQHRLVGHAPLEPTVEDL